MDIPFASLRIRPVLVGLVAAAQLVGCASGGGAGVYRPLPAAEVAALGALPRRAAAIESYLADGRMTHFAHGQRTRAQLQVLAQRPDSWRYTVLTPQGPPLFVLACDGTTLTSVEMDRSAFRELPATAQGLAELAPALDFSLTPRALLQLLFGEVEIPAGAEVLATASTLRYAWQAETLRWQADFDRKDGRLLRLEAEAAAATAGPKTGTKLLVAEVVRYSPEGLPAFFRLVAPAGVNGRGQGAGEQILEVEVGHFNLQPEVGSSAFVVRP